MISLTACKDNVKNLDMQAERQETTFRFRFFPPSPGSSGAAPRNIADRPSPQPSLRRCPACRIPRPHAWRASPRKSGAAPAGNGRMPCGVPPHLGL